MSISPLRDSIREAKRQLAEAQKIHRELFKELQQIERWEREVMDVDEKTQIQDLRKRIRRTVAE